MVCSLSFVLGVSFLVGLSSSDVGSRSLDSRPLVLPWKSVLGRCVRSTAVSVLVPVVISSVLMLGE